LEWSEVPLTLQSAQESSTHYLRTEAETVSDVSDQLIWHICAVNLAQFLAKEGPYLVLTKVSPLEGYLEDGPFKFSSIH
jgi:hypothetical protein